MADMKAAVLEAYGDLSHLTLKEVPIPEPKPEQVRIQIKAVGFNPVDYKIRQGVYGGEAPIILGCDCSGIIDKVGSAVEGFSVGDEVYAMAFGSQPSNGSYAEYLCIPANMVAPKPKKLSFIQAAAVPLAAMTAYRALITSPSVNADKDIFIAGAGGGVGSFAVQFAKYQKVKDIYSIARNTESAEYITKQLGIKPEHIILYEGLSMDALQEKIIKLHQGKLFEASYDFVGNDIKRLCLQLTNFSGHFASILPERGEFSFPVWEAGKSLCFNRSMSLHLIFVGAESLANSNELLKIYSRQLSHITELMDNGIIQVPKITVVGKFALETIKEAHRLLESGHVKGKLVMEL